MEYEFLVADCHPEGGIYRYLMSNGKTRLVGKLSIAEPMYMQIENEKLYIIIKAIDGAEESGLITYDICGNEFVNPSEIISTKGMVACHLWVSDSEVYCANYVSGSVIKMPDRLVELEGAGPNLPRQDKPHMHYITKTFDGYILAVDLGTDSIITYDTDMNELWRSNVPAGHGARHLVFSKDNRYVYCINELAATVSVFGYDKGKLDLKGTYESLPRDFDGKNTAAAIRISQDGKYLYVSNRGHDSITVFEIAGEELILRSITPCGGKSPRDFNVFNGQIICTNEESGNVTVFNVDGEKIEYMGEIMGLKRPLCVIEI